MYPPPLTTVKGGGYSFDMDNDETWRSERDTDGFPIANEDRKDDLFTDEYGVTYYCTFIDGLGWCWRKL